MLSAYNETKAYAERELMSFSMLFANVSKTQKVRAPAESS